jgi:hypothetical protein
MEKNARCRKATLAIAALLVAGALYPMTALGANKLIVKDSGGQVDKFVVTDTGTVGVGTNAPVSAVHVIGSETLNAYDPTSQVRIHGVGTGAAFAGGGILGLHNQPVSGGNPSGYPLAGDRLGYFLFGTQNLNGTDLSSVGITAFASDNWSTTGPYAPSYLGFETTGATPGRKTRLNIGPEGGVAINMGKTFTSQALEVVGGVKINNLFPGNPSRNPVKPACNATDGPTTRGTLWFTNNGASADTLEICIYDGAAYGWKAILHAP